RGAKHKRVAVRKSAAVLLGTLDQRPPLAQSDDRGHFGKLDRSAGFAPAGSQCHDTHGVQAQIDQVVVVQNVLRVFMQHGGNVLPHAFQGKGSTHDYSCVVFSNCSRSWARSSLRLIFKAAVSMKRSTNTIWSGTLKSARPRLRIHFFSSIARGLSSLGMMKAQLRSPRNSSGTDTTAASKTCGWASRWSSISSAEIFSPARLMWSVARP